MATTTRLSPTQRRLLEAIEARTDRPQDWVDWRRMDPRVEPAQLDAIDRAQIHAAQQPADANRPVREATSA
jgi:hypothetical protein